METRQKMTDFKLVIEKKNVLEAIKCYPDSPVYEMIEEEYESRIQQVRELLDPIACYRFAEYEGQPALYVMASVGKGVTDLCTRLFEENDALAGMLVDAMTDEALFHLAMQLNQRLHKICSARGVGAHRRIEAQHGAGMQLQEQIYELLQAQEMGFGITSGYMFDPVKTSGYVLLLCDDTRVFKGEHDCSQCAREDCVMRNKKRIEVIVDGSPERRIAARAGQNLMEILQQQEDGAYSFACGGKGICGKCKVQILEGTIEASSEDERFFTPEEIDAGFRLACGAIAMESCRIRFVGETEQKFEVLSGFHGQSEQTKQTEHKVTGQYGIAIDIGTTTIVAALMQEGRTEPVAVHTTLNRQRTYGADVITRMQASNEGKKEELQRLIREDLLKGIRSVLAEHHLVQEQVSGIAIAGNTTMGHLLMGYSCETLGVYPFTPVDLSARTCTFEDVFASHDFSIPVYLLPGISTFVGADITAGLLSCGFADREEVSLLIDLGTNGEMAIGNQNRILVTSTAAGPAFEGGNISCGTGSIEGAICDVQITDGVTHVKTIGGKPIRGLCGTGVIAVTAELLKAELVDEAGLMDEDYFDDGYPLGTAENGEEITFTQKDVREIQLAKSAVRAGIETLILAYGIEKEQIDRVYLAGGFGYKMDLQKAIEIGILPEELSGRIQAVGNSSLAGAAQVLFDAQAKKKLENIRGRAEEVSLSEDKNFQEFYMEYMMFGEE